jgi:hypothetical protein
MKRPKGTPKTASAAAETAREREARYFAGYEAISDNDEDFQAIARIGIENLRDMDREEPSAANPTKP